MAGRKGLFIVLDGPDGSGKSTQARMLLTWLNRSFPGETVSVREPGGTEVGEAVRTILLDRRHTEMTVECELLLYMASRAQLARQVILPAVTAGKIVVADRFLVASAVYQGLAGGVDMEVLMEIGRFATASADPDLTIIYNVSARLGLDRLQTEPDRIEAREESFHRRVQEGYGRVASYLPGPVVLLDGALPLAEVSAQTRREVGSVLEAAGWPCPLEEEP
jgi:dTMP kinase